MKTSALGVRLIGDREGRKNVAYLDTATPPVWTIGVGHTAAAGPPHPKKGMRITDAEIDRILQKDLAAFEKAVSSAVKVTMSQDQFDALVSWTFNIGAGGMRSSTAIARFNRGDVRGCARALLFWRKPPEISNRRHGEVLQFLKLKHVAQAPARDIAFLLS